MAGEFFLGLGQYVAGGVAVIATLGLNEDVIDFTSNGFDKMDNNAGKAWGADGDVTQFVESLPVVGYVAAAGHGIAAAVTGDKDDEYRARRATAASTKSTLVTAGAIGGGIVGGPFGAAGGAAVMSAGGQCAEKGINHSIDKKELQTSGGTFEDFSATSFVREVILDGAVAGVTAGTTKFVGKPLSRNVVGDSLKKTGGGGIKRYATKRTVEAAVSKPVGTATNMVGKKVVPNSNKN